MKFDNEKLRELRKARCWDQHRLAEEARRFPSGITQSQISRYENNQQPSGKNVLALAFALDIAPIDLYAAEDSEESRVADAAVSHALAEDLLAVIRRLVREETMSAPREVAA